MLLLPGKVAFVTGAGSGIGRATCQLLAREGAKVIAADLNGETARQTVALVSEHSDSHSAVTVDVTQAASVQTAVQHAITQYRQPATVIVNCAGITKDSFLIDMAEESFDDVISVNLKGTFLVTQAAVRVMVANGAVDGSIINVSSIMANTGNMGQANYAASKAGVIAFTKSTAKELARYNIRCNAVLPGVIDTPMISTIPDKVKGKFMAMVPAGRCGRPEEVAEVIAFLASGRSSYVNGTAIHITGGLG